ncbi:MAG: serine/threonine protein kinase [Thermoguttaceae bacterium]
MTHEQIGPYRIVGTLGRGGMGVVYHGINVETDEPAAIKILPAAMAAEEGFRQRFEVEIETLRKLYHPNIVQLFGFGEQDGMLFYAMEMVPGSSLEDEIRRGRTFQWREAAQIAIQTCRALRHAHDRGIIHRDIKPANLLMDANGGIKLSDFGIARLFGNTRITAAGNVLGTAEYMPPEQAGGGAIGPRSDLYSLGGVCFALLTRRAPFKARSLPEMLEKHRSERPEPVRNYAPDVPEEFERIIAQLLEKDPEKRIANATLVARRLEAMLRALSIPPKSIDRPAPPPAKPKAAEPTADDLPPTRIAGPSVLGVPFPSEAQNGKTAIRETRTHEGLEIAGAALENVEKTAIRETQTFEGAVQSKLSSPAEDLPETQIASEVFPRPRPQEAATNLGKSAAAGGTQRMSRFVVVKEEDLDRVDSEEQPHPLLSLETRILMTALVVVGLTSWYFLRPYTPESLYAKIGNLMTDESSVAAEPYVIDFLSRFRADARAERVREYQREIELRKLEQKLKLKGRLWGREGMLPIARAYIEAENYAWLSPDQGLAKFQALVELYGDRADVNGPIGQWVELAQQQIKRLRANVEAVNAQSLQQVESRLQTADQLRKKDPAAARAIWQAVVELYRDRPWARNAVQRAEAALAGKD